MSTHVLVEPMGNGDRVDVSSINWNMTPKHCQEEVVCIIFKNKSQFSHTATAPSRSSKFSIASIKGKLSLQQHSVTLSRVFPDCTVM